MRTFVDTEHGIFELGDSQEEAELVIDFYGHGMHELLSVAIDVVHEINMSKESPINLEDFTIIKAIILK